MMDTEFSILIIYWMSLYLLLQRKQRNKRWINRRWRVRPINEQRLMQGDYHNLFQQLKNDDDMFFRYVRMSVPTFNKLLEMVQPYLIKQSYRALSPEERLVITLR